MNGKVKRDLHLLNLLINRSLEEQYCEANCGPDAFTYVEASRWGPGRADIEFRFDLHKNMPAVVTDLWWTESVREINYLTDQAENFAESVEALWQERTEIKAMMSEVVAAVRREIAKAARKQVGYRLISAEISPIEAGKTELPYILVKVETLSASLVPAVIALEFDSREQVKETFGDLLEEQASRSLRRLELSQQGADGEIDQVALRVLELEGCDLPAVLSQLPNAGGGVLDVDFPGRADGGMVLFWKNGVVHANLKLTDKIRWSEGRVRFDELPKKFPAKPHGRKLSDFVKHAALPQDLMICAGYRVGTTASATVRVPTAKFNSQSGRAWAS